ncbi:cell division ATP-binding protein FtsE [Humibacillus xanthopallidus]|uniref:cell division ATP-binding protein FtsE n=1 Tax=Humibacillus xanthopallidus TaxID=412689 RepID=UPI00384F5533
MILFENVTKTYPKSHRPAVDRVSLEIGRGEFVFVVGTSGSGKSTMLQLIMKEQDATGGRISVAGRELDRLPDRKVPSLRRQIGCVFQDFRLLPNKTVHQNVAYALQVLGAPRSRIRSTVPEVLDLVGLAGMEKRFPHQLSGGEQQRVAIARAFVNRPPILLADEPTGNLDPGISLEIVQLLDRINRTGTTVVMATHDFATVDAMRKRVIRLDKGVLVGDVEAGEYTTGSIPRIELDDRPIPARVEEPAVADGYDDGAAVAPVAPVAPESPEPEQVEQPAQARQPDPAAYGKDDPDPKPETDPERQAAVQGSGR